MSHLLKLKLEFYLLKNKSQLIDALNLIFVAGKVEIEKLSKDIADSNSTR